MHFKTTLIAMVWASTVLAQELPPDLPFSDSDGGDLVPHQGGEAGDMTVIDRSVSVEKATPEQSLDSIGSVSKPTHEQVKESQGGAIQEVKKRPKILNKTTEITRSNPKNNDKETQDSQSWGAIKPKPGRTEKVVIARGKLNRIVTPYADPKVLTVDQVETKVDGSAVYIATDSALPVSLFISDAETGIASSIQLVPEEIGTPVEITIESDNGKLTQAENANAGALTGKELHQDTPYITEVKMIMQSLGKQQIPQGFTLEEVTDEVRSFTVCHDANLTFWPGQMLSGHGSRILVEVAQNNGVSPIVFEEAFCANEHTMAVAAWPKIRLEPGEKTEVYILMRLPDGNSDEEIRPPLL
jgi:conjugal transfer pilus assembly protein TraK